MRSINLLLLIIPLAAHSTLVQAQIYKWVDKNGIIHFTDNPPETVKTTEVELKINTYTAVEIKPLEERLGRKDKVVLYSTRKCGYCKKAKAYFRKNNIPYVNYDVENSRIGRMDYKALKGNSVPIIIVGNKRMNGFRAERFKKLYETEILAKKQETNAENKTIN